MDWISTTFESGTASILVNNWCQQLHSEPSLMISVTLIIPPYMKTGKKNSFIKQVYPVYTTMILDSDMYQTAHYSVMLQ